MPHRISAGALFATGLGFLAFAVTFLLAASMSDVMIGLGAVFSVRAMICFVAAYRVHYGPEGAALGGVSYPRFMKTREQLKADLNAAGVEISRLNAKIAELQAMQKAAQFRFIDMMEGMLAAIALKDMLGEDLRKRHVRIYPVPTVNDSSVVAAQIKELLNAQGCIPPLRNTAQIKRLSVYALRHLDHRRRPGHGRTRNSGHASQTWAHRIRNELDRS